MQKPLTDFAKHMKDLVLEIPADYSVKGIQAFHDFLHQFFDYIAIVGDQHDKPKPNANRVWGGINFTMDYPFLRDMAAVLMNIGTCAEFNPIGDTFVISGTELKNILKKAKVQKPATCLRHLTHCGIEFSGIDLDTEKPDLAKAQTLKISYPDNPAMLHGLKTMANAQIKINKKRYKEGSWACVNTIDNIFLRCDYNALEDTEIEQVATITDILKPFPPDTQQLVLSIHQRLLDSNFKCDITTGRNSAIGFYLLYAHKAKPKQVFHASWIIGITPNNCGIKIDAKHASEYVDIIENFPQDLLQVIRTGTGCVHNPAAHPNELKESGFKFIIRGEEYRKCSVIACSNNEYWIPLTDLTEEKNLAILKWIGKELDYV
ncbi:MAG: hypothetical protein FWC92_05180 [Defluviitaleaceae bacterium]|nr:hypothetical protein [Defluviitaleaceae bacterium]